MPLLLIDLDNTLVDRAAAFRAWAHAFCDKYVGADEDAVAWLVDADGDGCTPRAQLAALAREQFGLGPRARAELVEDLRWGMADHLEPDALILAGLRRVRDAGWLVVVVSNGTVEQQERKLRVTGLDAEVDGWVISEAAGFKKPEPEIFRLAASSVGQTLRGAWVIGDSARADIGGAHNLSLRSVWLHRGRPWREDDFAPTLQADSCWQATDLAMARRCSCGGE